MKVIEAFSGIGSQAKALKKIGKHFEILHTIEWDINAILAYAAMHHHTDILDHINDMSKEELVQILLPLGLSADGKEPISERGLKSISEDALKRIYSAIQISNNLVDITKVSANSINDDVDLFTYSFPCQDLSISGFFHGKISGIDRNVKNRSGMLWEVERILMEYVEYGKKLPRFLLMENVSNILSEQHKVNFEEWKQYLESIGYTNIVYHLNSSKFGIPQERNRVFMISVFGKSKTKEIKEYFQTNSLENYYLEPEKLENFLRIDYTNETYLKEANESNPNDTPSRRKIYNNNKLIWSENQIQSSTVKTITTKQDRNPNSGILSFTPQKNTKSNYRNLTPRECFLLMGFEESDYQRVRNADFPINNNRTFYGREKFIKFAGNSIVVNVLEEIFKQIFYVNEKIFEK